MSLICKAIREHRLLEFQYHGKLRVVAPYCHGTSTRGTDVLRAIEVGGAAGATSGPRHGKLWALADMVALRILDVPFLPNDPNYNPNDSAMKEIHCRV
jgi:hypothetical protein